MRALAVLLLLAACGGRARGGASEATSVGSPVVAGAPAAPPVCIKPPELDGKVTRVSGDTSSLWFCIGSTSPQCFAYDLGARSLELLAEPPAVPEAAARVEATSPRLEICTGDDCVSLTPKVLPTVAGLKATTNSDGSLAVVLLGDAERGKGYAEIWDVGKPRKLATVRYARGRFRCGHVAFAGETVFVSAATCGAPGARGVLYTKRGRRIGNVGGKDFGTFGTAFTQVEGNTFAFLEESGNRIAIQDVVKGKVIRTIDTSPLWSYDGQPDKNAIGNPGESAIVRLGNGKLAVIAGAPSTGKIAIVDVATGTLELLTAPVCQATI